MESKCRITYSWAPNNPSVSTTIQACRNGMRRSRILSVFTLIGILVLVNCSARTSDPAGQIVASTDRPGLYILQPDGTSMAPKGQPIPFQSWGQPGGLPPPLLWIPDEAHGDHVLRELRERFVGKTVHGYGGVAMSCPPQWTHLYGPSAPLRVASVLRDTGLIESVGTGTQLGIGAYGPAFYAKDPIRIVFDDSKVPYSGINYHIGGHPGRCPALVLADFQVDLAITTRRAPTGVTSTSEPLHIGMSRTSVVWSRGYPWEIADRQTLLKENVWHYGVGLSAYTVSFERGRVVRISRHV